MRAEEFRQTFERFALFQPVLDFAEVWFKQYEAITFHDPLAAVTIFDEGVFRFAKGEVEVELDDKQSMDKTNWVTGAGRHEVATAVDRNRFFEHFVGVFEDMDSDGDMQR